MLRVLPFLLLAACGTIETPPHRYRGANTVLVEFLPPHAVPRRCAERGAANAIACGNADALTLPNPCGMPGAGSFADLACHELAHANGWPPSHPK